MKFLQGEPCPERHFRFCTLFNLRHLFLTLPGRPSGFALVLDVAHRYRAAEKITEFWLGRESITYTIS